MKLTIKMDDIKKFNIEKFGTNILAEFPKYTSQIINLANQNVQVDYQGRDLQMADDASRHRHGESRRLRVVQYLNSKIPAGGVYTAKFK